MKPVQVAGHIDKNGSLELGQLPIFPPGEEVRALIMDVAGMAALQKMIDIVASAEVTDSVLLEQLDALDEAIWDAQFASSQDVLAKLAEQSYAEYKRGKAVELDLDELNRKDA